MRYALACLLSAIIWQHSLPAQAADPTPLPPLAPGEYLLVCKEPERNLKPLTISIRKDGTGALTISCPSAPLGPAAIFQRDSLFQFSLQSAGPYDPASGMVGEWFEGFMFVGSTINYHDKSYHGTFAVVRSNTITASEGASQGEFLLYPLPAKPQLAP